MNFNSLQFLVFLPVVVLLYRILPRRVRWVMLLAASYLFYMSWNVWLGGLILVTTLTAYVTAIGIGRTENKKIKKLLLAVALVVCLGLLVFFKYINFILESAVGVIRLFGGKPDDIVLNVILPVGISFYTFQTLSYVIDVYRGDFAAERHFGYFALYVAYFPQLVAGPIERPQNLLPQLRENRDPSRDDLIAGAKYLLSGFFRKCVVADFCGLFVNNVYGDLSKANGLAVFAASLLFFVQIYNDFAGYSEIAMGSARLMGVKLSKNFDKPLSSASYTEFFRRWHITLNQWFTQYVYIPLGGNRKGVARKIINTLAVFALCGLWHGANWTFVLWGLTAGVIVSMETLLKKPMRRLCEKIGINGDEPTLRAVRQTAVFVLFAFSSVLFRAQSLSEIGTAFTKMFTAGGFGTTYFDAALSSLGMSTLQILQLAAALVAMNAVYGFTAEKPSRSVLPLARQSGEAVEAAVSFVYGIFAVALCWLALLAISDASGFQYFQF